MPHPTGPTNEATRKLIIELRKKREKFYLDISKHLAKSRRSKAPVNIQKIGRMAKNYDAVAVPGKVLGVGELNKAVDVYALSFSKEAKTKITKAGGKAHKLSALLEHEHADVKARIVV